MLTKYGREVGSVFDLLGRKEVDLTAALGWALHQSPHLLDRVLTGLGLPVAAGEAEVLLEDANENGRTDIDISWPRGHVVIEAKQGWLVPGEEQLGKYRDRFKDPTTSVLVSLSQSSSTWARTMLPSEVRGVKVRHLSWDDVRTHLREAKAKCRSAERLWLQELENYMGHATSTTPCEDSWVYCVAISDQRYGDLTFRNYVEDERVYFHPFGGHNGWPKRAPNFLCFRWGGRVGQVNRVMAYEVVERLADRWPAIAGEPDDGPHIVYSLGPDIPIPEISTAGTYPSGRVWCLLDQLLTSTSLQDAVRSSRELKTG